MKFRALVVLALVFLMSCQRHYVSVSQRWIDGPNLASAKANTPDPRAENAPLGQMIVVDWVLSRDMLKQHPHIELDVIYWDYTTKTFSFPIKERMDWVTYKCLNEDYEKTGGILTYRAKILTEAGEVMREWRHQLWVNLIQLGE